MEPDQKDAAEQRRLIEAYRATRFVACVPGGEIVLRVGERNPDLDALLEQRRVSSCAFLTAWNPGSRLLAAAENARRQAALLAAAGRAGYPYLPGRGIGADGGWPSEESLLILGIARPAALALGRRFGQLAIVCAARGEPVELAIC